MATKQLTLSRRAKGDNDNQGQTAPLMVPTTWAVNLLPAETVQRNHERQLARRFVIAGLGAAALVGVVWTTQTAVIHMAKNDLAAAEEAQADARSQLVPLQPIKSFSVAMVQQEVVIGTTMANHTSFADALDSFQAAWPGGSSLRTLDAALGAGCPGPEPFAPPASIGCITWTVAVNGEKQVRDLVDDLSGEAGLVSPYLTGATRNESEFDATGTVNLTDELLTNRFTNQIAEATP